MHEKAGGSRRWHHVAIHVNVPPSAGGSRRWHHVAIHVNVPPSVATAQAPHSTSTSTAQSDRPRQSDRTIQNTTRQV
eukprot:scaffold4071_cov217-Isochrysis_galbana.AAC.1